MARVANDDYPTRPALARALLARMQDMDYVAFGTVLEPCAGDGQLVKPFRPYATNVITNDIDPKYNTDFNLDATQFSFWQAVPRPRWVITNPPFRQATEILKHAMNFASHGVAMLLRLSFLEPTSATKYQGREYYPRAEVLKMYAEYLNYLYVIGSPRPAYKSGRRTDSVTTAWFVWDKAKSWNYLHRPSPFQFITNWNKEK